MGLRAPSPLDDSHVLDDFRCASPDLTKWLRERARKNQREGATRCFVVSDAKRRVLGYYVLAAGSISHDNAPGSVRRNMPQPIPVAVLGRLAVHDEWTGHGIGRGLLKDAVLRTLNAAEEIGIRALLCHAIDPPARAFYLKHGFVESPIDAMTLMLNLGPLRLRAN